MAQAVPRPIVLLAPVLVGLLGLVTLRAQNPPPPPPPPDPQTQGQQRVFRTGVETVAIYASVLDEYGELVRGLTRDDFEVFDDGRRQDLSLFVDTFQPITATLLIDTSASMTLNLDLARLAAEQFIIRLMPDDEARVGSFADIVRYATELTGDRDTLLHQLRQNLDVGNPTKLWDSIDQARRELASRGGRRVLMLFTDGSDTASEMAPVNLLQSLRDDEVMIYVVHFGMPRWPDVEWSLYQVALRRTPPAGMRRPRSAREQQRLIGDDLRRIAEQTGGGYFTLRPTDDVNATFTRVTHELHHQYLMGFTPERLDGKTHALEVRVKDGWYVRARHSYRAPPPPDGGRR